MPLKVLHVITQLELGGAQKNVLSILSGLHRDKYEIHLISSPGLLEEEARSIPGLHLRLLSFLKRSPSPILDILAFLYLAAYMKKNRIDIVHTHSSKAGILGRWAARLAGVKVIIHTVHGWGFHDYFKSPLNDFYILLEKGTAKITTRLIAVTQNDIRQGLERGIGVVGQYVLIRCGIDKASLNIDERVVLDLRASLGLGDEKVVGMIACLKPQKNPLDLVRCAELVHCKHPDVKFLHVGDGLLRSKVALEIENRGLTEHFILLGWRKDVSLILPLFDVLVLTSLWEGLPIVFLEAMAFAKPIVAYDVSGLDEAVQDGVNGFLVPPKDVEQLAEKVDLLLEDGAMRSRMGQFSRVILDTNDFTLKTMVGRIETLYSLI